MDLKQVSNHWMYFLSLEKDFITTQNYVEITKDNFDTYSVEYSKILQLSCAEIDSVLRNLCSQLDENCSFSDENNRDGKIADYKKIIFKSLPNFKSAFVSLPHGYKIEPWKNWTNKQPPSWWSSYNLVKHYRHSNFQRANLENVISSLSALMLSILYLYRLTTKIEYAVPAQKPNYFLCEYISQGISFRGNGLPDIDT